MKHKKIYSDGKYVPLRMCVACRNVLPKEDMIKAVKKDGKVLIDRTGNAGGRGAYICKNEKCIEKAQKTRGLERGLKSAVPAEVYEECMRLGQ